MENKSVSSPGPKYTRRNHAASGMLSMRDQTWTSKNNHETLRDPNPQNWDFRSRTVEHKLPLPLALAPFTREYSTSGSPIGHHTQRDEYGNIIRLPTFLRDPSTALLGYSGFLPAG
jgi:hypothetical protein